MDMNLALTITHEHAQEVCNLDFNRTSLHPLFRWTCRLNTSRTPEHRRINTNIEYMLIVNFPLTKAMYISASRIEPNFTTGLGPIHVFVNLIIRVDLSIL